MRSTFLLASRPLRTLGWGICGLCVSLAAHAAPPTPLESIAHTVILGDTLERLALQYLGDASRWPALQASNHVSNPRRLQPGSVLRIPMRLLPSAPAKAAFVQGEVLLTTASGTAPVQAGQQIDEGARLQAGPDAFISVQLADGSVVRVQAQSDVQLRQMRKRGRAGSLQSVLEMHSGSLETSVPDQHEELRRFEIRTPTASTSVRGTHFDVALAPDGRTTAAVVEGSVAVRPLGAAPQASGALLHPGQGVAVSAAGELGQPRVLLPAPDLSALPAAVHDAALLTLPLPPLGQAAAWQVRIAQDAQFTQVLRQGRFSGPQASWRGLDDGTYYVAVRGLDDAGIPGYAAQRPLRIKTRPIPPLAQSPAPSAILARGLGELRCTEVPGVRWYHLQVAREPGFRDMALSADRQADCRLALAELPPGSYHWRVASVAQTPEGTVDEGPFSPPQPFTVADRPAPLQSIEARDGGPNVALHWAAQPGQRFRLQLARDMLFAQTVEDQQLGQPEWSAQGLPAGVYYVRIQVLSDTGLQSDFSQPRKITVGGSVQDGSGQPLHSPTGVPVQSQ